MTKKLSADQEQAIMLLRYRMEAPQRQTKTFLSYPRIARLTGIRVSAVAYACRKAMNSARLDKESKKR